MATRVYGTAEALAETAANTTATPADAVTLVLPDADISGKTVAVFFSAGYSQRTNNTTQANARLQQKTSAVELFRCSREPFTITADIEWPIISGVWPLTFGASPGAQTVALQYFNETGTADVRMRDACLAYVVLGANDLAASTTAATPTSASTTWVDYLTWTAPATGTFAFFACGALRSSATTSSAGWRVLLEDNATARFTATNLPDDIDDYMGQACYFQRALTSGQTIKIQHNRGTGSGTITPQRAAIIGFRTSDFDATYNVEDHTTRSTTSTTNVTRNAASELTATPANVAHLMFGSANLIRSTNVTRSAIVFKFPTGTEQTEGLWRGNGYSQINVLSFRLYTPAASSTTWRPEMRSVEAGTTNSDAATMGGFQLAASAVAITTASPTALTIATFAPNVQVGTVLTPGVLALTTATFAPTVSVGTTITTAAPTALALTAFAPTVATPTAVTPGVKALTLTAFAPTVQVGTQLTPGVTALTLTTFAPTVGVGTAITTASPTALTLTTFAPTVATPVAVTTAAPTALTLTTFAPTVVVNTPITTAAPTALTLTTYAPAIGTQLTPATKALTLTTFAPAVGTQLTPGTKALTLTTFAPTVATPVAVTPGVTALTIATFAPNVQVGSASSLTPGTKALTLTTFAPTVATPTAVTPATTALTVATYAPAVKVDQRFTPTPATLTTSLTAPTVAVGSTLTPGVNALTITLRTPTVVVNAAINPAPAVLAITAGTPTVSADNHLTPATLALALATYAPLIVIAAVRPVIIGAVTTGGYSNGHTAGDRGVRTGRYSGEYATLSTSTSTRRYE